MNIKLLSNDLQISFDVLLISLQSDIDLLLISHQTSLKRDHLIDPIVWQPTFHQIRQNICNGLFISI